MRKGNRRLNYEDRQKIEKMAEQGARVIVIADTIGFHRATIYNELKRGGTPYRADVAQRTPDGEFYDINPTTLGEETEYTESGCTQGILQPC